MNESVGFEELELMRNSLIFTGLTFRTFSVVISICRLLLFELVHETLPTRSPLRAAEPEVILKVALTLAPGSMGSVNVLDASFVPETEEVHCLLGAAMLSVTSRAGSPVLFVNVAAISRDEPGEKVWSPGGLAVADAGARARGATLYLAATMLA